MTSARTGVARYAYAMGILVVLIPILVLVLPNTNDTSDTSASLLMVLAVMMVAVWWGSGPALLTSAVSFVCLDYFFIRPVHTLNIADPQDLVACATFVLSALTVGELSARARQRAEEAEERRVETEKLYAQLKDAIDKATEAETLRKSEKLKTALLDAVTHDLRTPLTSIKASATTLLGSSNGKQISLNDEARRELLEIINEESDRLNHFVEEMMTMAQLEGGRLALHAKPVSAQDVINNALDRAGTQLEAFFVEITVQDKLPALNVDAISISGVVYQLLDNAAKYSPPRSTIHVAASLANAGHVEIAVTNEGSPVAPELRARVFDKYFRAPSPTFTKQGFGLGLAIARGIVEAHGGEISMDAGANGRGTVVRFTVPSVTQVHV